MNSVLNEVIHTVIQSSGSSSTKTHRHNSRLTVPSQGSQGLLLHPVQGSTDVGGVAVTLASQHTHAVDSSTLGDAIGRSKNSTCAVGAVSVAVAWITIVVNKVRSNTNTAGEFLVGLSHTGVHDIHVHACSGDIVLKLGIERQVLLVKSVQSPLGIGLLGESSLDFRLLNDDVSVCESYQCLLGLAANVGNQGWSFREIEDELPLVLSWIASEKLGFHVFNDLLALFECHVAQKDVILGAVVGFGSLDYLHS